MPFRSEKQRRWMWANKPALAQEWADKYGSTPVKKDTKMPKKAATPLKGPIKKGTGKALIAKAGGGKKALKTWRSLSRPIRKAGVSKGGPRGEALLDFLADTRSNRITRKTIQRRTTKAKARAVTATGAPAYAYQRPVAK